MLMQNAKHPLPPKRFHRAKEIGTMKPDNTRLPLWLRITLYATENADETGTCVLGRGELRKAFNHLYDRRDVARAIRSAKSKGVITRDSHAHCLKLVP